MKDQIVAKFKAKFPAVTLSNKRLDEIADRLSKKVTNEEEIDAKLDEMNELLPFADIQKSDDKIRDLNGKLKTATQPATTSQDQSTSTTTQDNADDTPAWAKALVESNQQLAQKLAVMEKEKNQQSMLQKIGAHEKLKTIPESRRNILLKGRALPEKDEDLETFVDGFKADYDAFVTEENNEGLINGHKPAGGGSSGPKPGISSDMKEYLAAKKTAEAASNKN
jgi:hypothetical protein